MFNGTSCYSFRSLYFFLYGTDKDFRFLIVCNVLCYVSHFISSSAELNFSWIQVTERSSLQTLLALMKPCCWIACRKRFGIVLLKYVKHSLKNHCGGVLQLSSSVRWGSTARQAVHSVTFLTQRIHDFQIEFEILVG